MTDEQQQVPQDREPRRRVRMPIEDRHGPDEWVAEHPDGEATTSDEVAARDAERVHTLPWGYRM